MLDLFIIACLVFFLILVPLVRLVSKKGNSSPVLAKKTLLFQNYSPEMQEVLNAAIPKSILDKNAKNKSSEQSIEKKPSASLDNSFKSIVSKINSERTLSIFHDYSKCKSLLQDYTAGKFKKEVRLMLVAIEAGCPKEIEVSADPEITINKLISKLNVDYSIEKKSAKQIIELLYEVYNKGVSK